MWQQTKHGLYKQFNFTDFREAWEFMSAVADLAERLGHHPRWENDWSVVQIWLITHDSGSHVTDLDRQMSGEIDALLKNGVPRSRWAEKAIDDEPAGEPSSAADKGGSSAQRPSRVKLYADGGSRGNPGPSASGYVLYDQNDQILADEGVYIGVTTNNQAEYNALKIGLAAALKLGARDVEVYMDSLLVVNQMRRIFKIKNRDLWPLHDAVQELVPRFKKVTFTHVPRELNKEADAAVNRALDAHQADAN